MQLKRFKRYWMLLRIFLHRGGYKRAAFLKKKQFFKAQGAHCYFQPWNFGTEPFLISFGDNVHVASGVVFVNHDVTALMFRYMENDPSIRKRRGEIRIGDNVFIGANSTVLYDVEIGDNVIIGAGSLVNKSIPSGTIAAGGPCRVIGKFDDYKTRSSAAAFPVRPEKMRPSRPIMQHNGRSGASGMVTAAC